MAERIQKKKQTTEAKAEVSDVQPEKATDTEALKAEIDNLLDEIDEVLEENAETFVRDYIQKGGE